VCLHVFKHYDGQRMLFFNVGEILRKPRISSPIFLNSIHSLQDNCCYLVCDFSALSNWHTFSQHCQHHMNVKTITPSANSMAKMAAP
jgi:hypothetical protein